MTTIQGAIYDRLINGSVADKVGIRVFMDDFAPNDTQMPFIVCEVDRIESDADLGGTTDFAHADVTVICFDQGSNATQLLAHDVRRDMQDWQDDGSDPVIEWSLYLETISGTVEETRSQKFRYRQEVSFRINFRDVTIDDL